MPYLSASAVVIHYKEALYQVYAPLPYLYLNDIVQCFLQPPFAAANRQFDPRCAQQTYHSQVSYSMLHRYIAADRGTMVVIDCRKEDAETLQLFCDIILQLAFI